MTEDKKLSELLKRYLNWSIVMAALKSWSSSEPVASLRYLAINGMVLPPSISSTVCSTCHGFKLNSVSSCFLISI